jgi:hypothetical protein
MQVELNTHLFFDGYSRGAVNPEGLPMLLKLEGWPHHSSFEERLPRHGAEFMSALPFREYTDHKSGPLNLAVQQCGTKLPTCPPLNHLYTVSEFKLGHIRDATCVRPICS